MSQITDGVVYFKATESITRTNEDFNQQRRITLYCTSQMWKSGRLFISQITDGVVYFKETENIT